jgi:hypothetical protein
MALQTSPKQIRISVRLRLFPTSNKVVMRVQPARMTLLLMNPHMSLPQLVSPNVVNVPPLLATPNSHAGAVNEGVTLCIIEP